MIQCWLMPAALLSPPHLLYFRSIDNDQSYEVG